MANQPQNRDAVIDVDMSKGIDADSIDKSGMSWAQNIEYRVNRIEVRGGFGTLAQFGTTLNAGRQNGQTYGYGAPLGGALQLTNQGHAQILTVHPLTAYTGTLTGAGQVLSNLYALSVYDIATGRRLEHVFRTQTQWVDDLPFASLPSRSQPQWREVAQVQVPSFVQLNDLQYICLPEQGVWMYRPVDPYAIDQRLQTVPGTVQNGDDAWCEQVSWVDGVYASAGAVYFSASTFPLPSAMCAYQNRMVYASGRKLYFSDPDRPDNVQANSFFAVPTERQITALAVVKGVVLVFTSDETWMYQPSDPNQTGLVSGGNIYNLSRSIGCLTPQSLTLMQDAVVFMDRRGVYVNDGSTDIQKISGDIDTWFALPEQIQNPLSSYLTQQGLNTLTNQQPRAFIDLQSQLYRSTMTWDPLNQLLYVTFDDISLVYCPAFGWSVYLYETMAVVQGGTPKVGLTQRIVDPILFAFAGDLYMVAGPDAEAYSGITDQSVYVLKAGRGGALDRSSVPQEDLRQPYQLWTRGTAVGSSSPQFWLAPAIRLPDGFRIDGKQLDRTWLVPVYAAQGTGSTDKQVATLALDVLFDNALWQPVLATPGLAPFEYIVAPNRIASGAGFVEMEIQQGGVADPNGDTFHLLWDGSAAPNTWTSWPFMALNTEFPQPVVYLLLQRRAGTEAVTSLSPQFSVSLAQFGEYDTGLRPINAQVWICNTASRPSYPQQDLGDNTHAQPVDWAISTPLLGDGKAQYKARGAYTTLQSYGSAAAKHVPGWPVGPYASMTTSDYKDFATQQVDWRRQDPHVDQDKPSVRARIELLNGVQPTTKTGANVARWSSTAAQSTGNLLIDDAATDTIAGSETVQGERFRTMLFGCMNANGEDVKIARVRILTRMTGGLRRTGRTRLA